MRRKSTGKKSKYQRQAAKIGYCKVQRHPHRLAAVLRPVYGRNRLSRRSTGYEVLLAQGWSIAYNRRLPTSEKYTKRQVWERKWNCYRLRHQHHVTSDDSWNQPKQNLRFLWKAVAESTLSLSLKFVVFGAVRYWTPEPEAPTSQQPYLIA